MRPADQGLEPRVLIGDRREFLEQYDGMSVNTKAIGVAYCLRSCLRTFLTSVRT
jgi:hypothetical protein